MKTKLPTSEEFASVQGEGKYAGVPSYFVRTSGCNLRCWWCDTPYTSWKPESAMQEAGDILDRIAHSNCDHVVVTGGEPMMFAEQVAHLVSQCREALGKTVTIETNGTIYDKRVQPNLWSVSPKLHSSTPSESDARERELHLRNMACADLQSFALAEDCQFKFVVTQPQDMAEVRAIVHANGLQPRMVWLMPEGRTAAEVMEKAKWVVEQCKEHRYNLSMRVHTLLWGPKRGM